MKTDNFATQMRRNSQSFVQLLAGISEEQAKWKLDEQSWSLLEVINHLYDTEREDFRVRVDYILHKPNENPPQIDEQAWVTERAYNSRDLQQSLDNFLQEREQSLHWIASLDNPAWDNVYAAEWGSIRAGDIFAAWLAHDFLHMRQIAELQYLWIQEQAKPYDVAYAGEF